MYLFSTFSTVSAKKKPFWSVASAAYQVEGAWNEGGRSPSIWDEFAHTPGKVHDNENGDVAVDFYHRYLEDIALMKEMGVDYFRFSISWSRILPDGATVNMEGVKFYNDVIDALLDAGITPFVTLYHWDLPQILDQLYGGWLSENIQEPFVLYASTCFRHFGDRVKKWLTFNEPLTFCLQGYGDGSHAPGRCSDRSKCDEGDSSTEPYICSKNVLVSHAKAVALYRKKFQKEQEGEIGITNTCDFGWPYDPDNVADVVAFERYQEFLCGWWMDPINFGDYPNSMRLYVGDRLPTFSSDETALLQNSYDFIGLNHYTSRFVQADMTSKGGNLYADMRVNSLTEDVNGNLIGPRADSSWEYSVPQGIRGILNWVDQRYNRPSIYLTENGCSVPGESQQNLEDSLHDDFRSEWYINYIWNVYQAAVVDGVDVRSYTAWSMMDNFEWADGYDVRFGLYHVEYDNNLTRVAKDSVNTYKKIMANYTFPIQR